MRITENILKEIKDLYLSGKSISDISSEYNFGLSTIRYHLNKNGLLRSNTDALRIASAQGKLGTGDRSNFKMPEHSKKVISKKALERGEKTALGVSFKTNGHVEYTRGEHKGRNVHVVKFEEKIGRKLLEDECVHHIDGDKHNNDINNLALMTRSAHGRLHRREDKLQGKKRSVDKYGKFK